jgi:DNA polymerase
MTAEEKISAARFLDMTMDYLRDGYRQTREEYAFAGDPSGPPGQPEKPAVPSPSPAPPASGNGDSVNEDAPQPDSLEAAAEEIRRCTACPLHTTRKKAVPGEGTSRPLVMVIGEGPGADEDASGRPFVGRAGQLLDKMLAAIGLYRDKNCFIANVVKCRPPGNRDPLPGETLACAPFLARQTLLLKPLVILSVGRVSARLLLNTDEGIGKLRGRFFDYDGIPGLTIPLFPTYHPSALLRDESLKKPAWADLQILMKKLAGLDQAYAEATEGIREKLAKTGRPGETPAS